MGIVLEVAAVELVKSVPRETFCKCGNPARPGQRYCWRCHAVYRRRYKHSDLSPEAKIKLNARRYVNTYIERGLVHRGKCETCDSPDTQPHHEDYSKPLEVRWFCREHHLSHEGKQMHKPTIERH